MGIQEGVKRNVYESVRKKKRGQYRLLNTHINKVNHAMNVSYDLALRFGKEFGSTLCNDIIQEDFSSRVGVDKYVSENRIDKCRQITAFVVENVRKTIDEGLTVDAPAKKWK